MTGAQVKGVGMSGLEIGMLVRDNDPRMFQRVLRIHALHKRDGGDVAVLRHPKETGHTWETRVRVDRIHTDGKPRRSGWSVVA